MFESEDFDIEIWSAFAHSEQIIALDMRSKMPCDFITIAPKNLCKPVAKILQPPFPWDCEPDIKAIPETESIKLPFGSGDNYEVSKETSSFGEIETDYRLQIIDQDSLDLEVSTIFQQIENAEPLVFHQSPPSAILRPLPVCKEHEVEARNAHNDAKPVVKTSGKKTTLRSLFRGLRKLFRRKKL